MLFLIKKCEWCGNEFEVKSAFSRDKYCDEHKNEAHKESVRKARKTHYNKYKKENIMSQIGTTTMSKHPQKNFVKEQEVITNELKRNNCITTVYKGRNTYNKGFIIFTQFPKITDTHMGTQITHNYATFSDYSNQHTQLMFYQHINQCPECNSQNIEKDRKHATVNCKDCGLVLLGPPIEGIIYPMRLYPMNDRLAPIFNKEVKPLPKIKKQTFKDEVKVICKTCHEPYVIPFKEKADFRCDCGSKVMGVGICMPRDFDDEFTPYEEDEETGYDLSTTENRDI